MKFNEKQLKVIENTDENIMLMASAGTGKTAVLTERVLNIINKNLAKEEEILCITFTNKAAKEMKDRIEEKLKGVTKSTIKTFHSFCLEIIRDNAKKKTDIPIDFIVFDEEDARETVKKIAAIRLKGYDRSFIEVSMIQKFLDLVKAYRYKWNMLTENAEEDYKECVKKLLEGKFKNELVKECFSKSGKVNIKLMNYMIYYGFKYCIYYDTQLRNDKALDFNDLTTITKKLFEDEEVINYYKEKYKFINIDEVQDTSISDYEIIEKLFKNDKNKNILICGDRFQTIYKWRGSEPEKIFEAFRKECNPIEIVFDRNYRATKILTDASISFLINTFEEKALDIYKDGLKSVNNNLGEKIKIIKYEDIEKEADGILKAIKELELKGEDLSSICVLTRMNSYNIELSKILSRISNEEKFEFILVDQYKFFRRAEIKDITAMFKILVNPYDTVSLERILKRFNTKIGRTILEKIESKEYKIPKIKLSDFISEYTQSGEFYTNLLNAYDNEEIVVFDVESTGVDVTEDEIIQIAAIKIDKNGNIIDTYERFIKPNKPVGASVKVHGFTDEFLNEKGGSKDEVLKEFREYTKGKIVVGHNVQYDINIFTSELNRYKIGSPLFKGFYDTLDIYRRFYPLEKNHKLEYLSERFGTNHKPSHNALDDITATKELLVMAIKEKIRPTTLERTGLMGNLYKDFEEFREKYRNLCEKSYEYRPKDMIDEIEKMFRVIERYPVDEREERSKRVLNFKKILSILDEKAKNPRDALISAIELTALSGGEIEEIIGSTEKKKRIPIITVHQAKGLEYDTVIVSGIVDGKFPIWNGDLDEEGKLFYVAITRAKKNLILTYPNKYKTLNGNERDGVKSPFLEKIDEKFLEDIE